MQRIEFLLILIMIVVAAGVWLVTHGNDGTFQEGSVPEQNDTSEIVNEAFGLYQSQNFAGAIELLEPVTQREPDNGRAWLFLGLARHSMGDLDKALEAHMKAVAFEETSVRAMYNVARTWARKGDEDKAFEWLAKVHEAGKFNLTEMALDEDLKKLKDDPRFTSLLPRPEEFKAPFVEPITIHKDWSGESEGDAFGWIARNIGDVDGDGINDVTTFNILFSSPFV